AAAAVCLHRARVHARRAVLGRPQQLPPPGHGPATALRRPIARPVGASDPVVYCLAVSQVRGADIRVLYLRELRSALRERAIVVTSILLPIFLYPLLLWLVSPGISFVGGQTEGFTSRVMLRGLPEEHRLLRIDLERDRQIDLRNVADPGAEIRRGK